MKSILTQFLFEKQLIYDLINKMNWMTIISKLIANKKLFEKIEIFSKNAFNNEINVENNENDIWVVFVIKQNIYLLY